MKKKPLFAYKMLTVLVDTEKTRASEYEFD